MRALATDGNPGGDATLAPYPVTWCVGIALIVGTVSLRFFAARRDEVRRKGALK